MLRNNQFKSQLGKGIFEEGLCIRGDGAIQGALKYNPQSSEVAKKIKKLSQLAKEKKRADEVQTLRSNIDMGKHVDILRSEMSAKYKDEESCKAIFSFLVETMEAAVKSWHEASKVDGRVYFLLDKEKTDTEKYAPAVNIDKAFESPEDAWELSNIFEAVCRGFFLTSSMLHSTGKYNILPSGLERSGIKEMEAWTK